MRDRKSDLDGPVSVPHYIDVIGFYIAIVFVVGMMVAVHW